MTTEREALRLGIEYLTVLFPTEVGSFDFQVESTDWTAQYKLNAQSLRLFGLHRDVNDTHRDGCESSPKKQKHKTWFRFLSLRMSSVVSSWLKRERPFRRACS